MNPFHIIGHAGCGKTTLISDLIQGMVERGIRVGSMKHSAHVHELDKPGKDSYIHRQAGAVPVTMVTEKMTALYLPRTQDYSPKKLLEKFYQDADIVLIEGWISGPYPKIEVWRKKIERPPLFTSLGSVRAFVSDDPMPEENDIGNNRPIQFKRTNIKVIIDFLVELSHTPAP